MPEPTPPLDREALRGLVEIVRDLGGPRPSVPMAELVGIPARLTGGVALTVDLALSRELGREFIVLRVPVAAGPPPPDPCLAFLTPREAEVAALIAAGLANKQIAGRLSLSLATIKSHVHHILAKTGLPNRAAVAVAVAGHPGPSGDRPVP